MKNISKKVDQLRQHLSELNLSGQDAIYQIESAIQLINSTTMLIEKEIEDSDFISEKDEIQFFRHIKPPLYSLHIAYRKILKIELLRPSYNKKEFKAILKQKLDFIRWHYIDYPEFTRYYNSTSTDNDHRYFLRLNNIELDCFVHIKDNRNSTGYDIVAAYLLAYKYLTDHYDQNDKKEQIEKNVSSITWVGDKIALVELISGLHLMTSIKCGENDLKTLATSLCKLFNVEVKDFYGKRREIKERKGEKFKYIHQMLDILQCEFKENLD